MSASTRRRAVLDEMAAERLAEQEASERRRSEAEAAALLTAERHAEMTKAERAAEVKYFAKLDEAEKELRTAMLALGAALDAADELRQAREKLRKNALNLSSSALGARWRPWVAMLLYEVTGARCFFGSAPLSHQGFVKAAESLTDRERKIIGTKKENGHAD